ncbi:mediator of DNA damage checkpoint protein 1 isoform X2 [Ranitomeya imitator]|uniref:mediator of DNA damage checkpoint protein 1 isoform X2 n=1 Tax=Ranitomeya imitator TaxID=111125 RepID=UPI0037E85583
MDETQRLDHNEDTEEETSTRDRPVGNLHMFAGIHGPAQDFSIYRGQNLIGRHASCDITLPAQSVSKKHAILDVSGDCHTICDNGSLNKTRRGKTALAPHVRYSLSGGDFLLFADVACRYTIEENVAERTGVAESEDDSVLVPATQGALAIEKTPGAAIRRIARGAVLARDSGDEDDKEEGQSRWNDGGCGSFKDSHKTSHSGTICTPAADTIVPESDEENDSSTSETHHPPLNLRCDSDMDTSRRSSFVPSSQNISTPSVFKDQSKHEGKMLTTADEEETESEKPTDCKIKLRLAVDDTNESKEKQEAESKVEPLSGGGTLGPCVETVDDKLEAEQERARMMQDDAVRKSSSASVAVRSPCVQEDTVTSSGSEIVQEDPKELNPEIGALVQHKLLGTDLKGKEDNVGLDSDANTKENDATTSRKDVKAAETSEIQSNTTEEGNGRSSGPHEAAFHMDSDTDFDDDEPAATGSNLEKTKPPKVLDAEKSINDASVQLTEEDLDSDTDVEGDQNIMEPKDGVEKMMDEPSKTEETTMLGIDSDTDDDDSDEDLPKPAESKYDQEEEKKAGFHLDSDTDVEEDVSTADVKEAQPESPKKEAKEAFNEDSDTDVDEEVNVPSRDMTKGPQGSSKVEKAPSVNSDTDVDEDDPIPGLSRATVEKASTAEPKDKTALSDVVTAAALRVDSDTDDDDDAALPVAPVLEKIELETTSSNTDSAKEAADVKEGGGPPVSRLENAQAKEDKMDAGGIPENATVSSINEIAAACGTSTEKTKDVPAVFNNEDDETQKSESESVDLETMATQCYLEPQEESDLQVSEEEEEEAATQAFIFSSTWAEPDPFKRPADPIGVLQISSVTVNTSEDEIDDDAIAETQLFCSDAESIGLSDKATPEPVERSVNETVQSSSDEQESERDVQQLSHETMSLDATQPVSQCLSDRGSQETGTLPHLKKEVPASAWMKDLQQEGESADLEGSSETENATRTDEQSLKLELEATQLNVEEGPSVQEPPAQTITPIYKDNQGSDVPSETMEQPLDDEETQATDNDATQAYSLDVPDSDGGTAHVPGSDSGTAQVPGSDSGTAQVPGSDSGTAQVPGSDSGTAQVPGSDSGTAQVPGSDSGTAQVPGSDSGTAQVPGSDSGTAQVPGSDSGTAQVPGSDSGTAQVPGSDSGTAQVPGSDSGTAQVPGSDSGTAQVPGSDSGTAQVPGSDSGTAQVPGSDSGTAQVPGSDSGTAQVPGSDSGTAQVPGSDSGTAQVPGSDSGTAQVPGSDSGTAQVPGSDSGNTLACSLSKETAGDGATASVHRDGTGNENTQAVEPSITAAEELAPETSTVGIRKLSSRRGLSRSKKNEEPEKNIQTPPEKKEQPEKASASPGSQREKPDEQSAGEPQLSEPEKKEVEAEKETRRRGGRRVAESQVETTAKEEVPVATTSRKRTRKNSSEAEPSASGINEQRGRRQVSRKSARKLINEEELEQSASKIEESLATEILPVNPPGEIESLTEDDNKGIPVVPTTKVSCDQASLENKEIACPETSISSPVIEINEPIESNKNEKPAKNKRQVAVKRKNEAQSVDNSEKDQDKNEEIQKKDESKQSEKIKQEEIQGRKANRKSRVKPPESDKSEDTPANISEESKKIEEVCPPDITSGNEKSRRTRRSLKEETKEEPEHVQEVERKTRRSPSVKNTEPKNKENKQENQEDKPTSNKMQKITKNKSKEETTKPEEDIKIEDHTVVRKSRRTQKNVKEEQKTEDNKEAHETSISDSQTSRRSRRENRGEVSMVKEEIVKETTSRRTRRHSKEEEDVKLEEDQNKKPKRTKKDSKEESKIEETVKESFHEVKEEDVEKKTTRKTRKNLKDDEKESKQTEDNSKSERSTRTRAKTSNESRESHEELEVKKTAEEESSKLSPQEEKSQPAVGRGRRAAKKEDIPQVSTPVSSRKRGQATKAEEVKRKKSEKEEDQKEEELQMVETPKSRKGRPRKLISVSENSQTVKEISPPDPSPSRGTRQSSALSTTPEARTPRRTNRTFTSVAATSPYVAQSGSAPKILFTGVVDTEGEEAIRSLGGEIAESVFDCTHLVTDRVRRTVKFLCALARGIPIVTLAWIDKCKKSGCFLSPNGFLVNDKEQEKTFNFMLSRSLQKAKKRPLLEGYEIHVTANVKPEPDHMKDIIRCSGATFLPKLPRSFKEKCVIVSCPEDAARCKSVPASVPITSAEFILSGILRQEVNPTAYLLNPTAPDTGPTPAKRRR